MAFTKIGIGVLLTILIGLAGSGRAAEPLQTPSERTILTVRGAISRTNVPGGAAFDRQMIEGLGMSTLRTSTSFTDGVTQFEGVLVRDLIAAVEGKGETVRATALNDYAVEIPMDDFFKFPVMLALKMNGSYLTVRDKGPIWIVYPRDQFKELTGEANNAKWIWQLKELQIK